MSPDLLAFLKDGSIAALVMFLYLRLETRFDKLLDVLIKLMTEIKAQNNRIEHK